MVHWPVLCRVSVEIKGTVYPEPWGLQETKDIMDSLDTQEILVPLENRVNMMNNIMIYIFTDNSLKYLKKLSIHWK